MKNIIILLLLLFTINCGAHGKPKTNVNVHISGYVNKVGPYRIPANASPEDILKACGGVTKLGSILNVAIIRFSHKANSVTGATKREKTEVIYYDFRRKDSQSISLQDGDLIFFRQGRIIGK